MARVLIYAMNYAPEPIGVGRYTGDIGAHLAREGHEIRVVTSVPHYPEWQVAKPFAAFRFQREQRDGATVLHCPLALRQPMRGAWRLLAPLSFAAASVPALIWEFLSCRPEVVFCVEPTLFAAPIALLLGKLFGARSVLHVQDLEIDAAFAVGHLRGALMRRFALWCEAAVLRRFDHVITISSRMRERLIGRGLPGSRVTLVRNWVDLDAIKPLQGRNRYREEFDWPDSLFIALYAGSIGAKQALHVALDAAELLEGRPGILFVVAGDGPAKDALVQRYGHLPNLRFLPPQPEERMCDLLNLADVHLLPQVKGVADLVLPSKLGGMLASGKPVLATADQGSELYDVLEKTAVVVPAGDSAAIARELIVFADGSGHLPDTLGSAGRELAGTMGRDACLREIALATVSMRS